MIEIVRRLFRTEWRYTYRSARRDGWSRQYAFRLWAGEMRKGIRDLPAAYRERQAV